MIPVQRTKPHAGAIIEPEPPAFTLFLWYFESFLVPDPFDALVVDYPTIPLQEHRDATISIPSVLTRERTNIFPKCRFIIRNCGNTSLRRSWLAYDKAYTPFRIRQQLLNLFGGPAPFGRA